MPGTKILTYTGSKILTCGRNQNSYFAGSKILTYAWSKDVSWEKDEGIFLLVALHGGDKPEKWMVLFIAWESSHKWGKPPCCTTNGLDLPGLHVVDIVEVEDGDGLGLLPLHHPLRVHRRLQWQISMKSESKKSVPSIGLLCLAQISLIDCHLFTIC